MDKETWNAALTSTLTVVIAWGGGTVTVAGAAPVVLGGAAVAGLYYLAQKDK